MWLSGTAGEDAAIRAGVCTETTRSDCLPNNYFIENESTAVIELPIDDNALLFMETWRMEVTGSVTTQEIGLADFTELINDTGAHWNQLPYNVTLTKGVVTRIEEVYVP